MKLDLDHIIKLLKVERGTRDTPAFDPIRAAVMAELTKIAEAQREIAAKEAEIKAKELAVKEAQEKAERKAKALVAQAEEQAEAEKAERAKDAKAKAALEKARAEAKRPPVNMDPRPTTRTPPPLENEVERRA